MSTLVKLQRKGQMVIPRALRERAGISEGTLLDIALVEGGNLLITPQLTINRSIVTAPAKNRKQPFRNLAQVVAEIRQEPTACSTRPSTRSYRPNLPLFSGAPPAKHCSSLSSSPPADHSPATGSKLKAFADRD